MKYIATFAALTTLSDPSKDLTLPFKAMYPSYTSKDKTIKTTVIETFENNITANGEQ